MLGNPATQFTSKTIDYEQYMARVQGETIPAYEPSLGTQELEFLTDVVERNWFSEGKYTREFEGRLAKISERAHGLAFCNATSALITGMRSRGIGPGDEVIVPSFTHPADPNSIAATGAAPAFADVDAGSMTLSVRTIDAAKTEKTKAVLYVSLYGNAAELEEIVDYTAENRLILINDCAAALCGTYKGKAVASYGDFSALSFFADKTITTGEGGMLLTDDIELIDECNIYKHDGRRERGHDLIERRGYNFRMTELQAAVGVAQLNRLEELIQRKRESFALYEALLGDVLGVSLFQFNPEGRLVPHRNIVMVPEARPLIDHLSSLGIGVRTMFMPMHSQPCYDSGQRFPVTEELYRTGVCLPSAPSLTRENIEFICAAIKRYYE
jgi:perosamine synthetase